MVKATGFSVKLFAPVSAGHFDRFFSSLTTENENLSTEKEFKKRIS
jgi:hypothetical protein